MSCHIVFPYEWVECTTDGDNCRSIFHVDADAYEMNATPLEWLQSLHGFSYRAGAWYGDVLFFTDDDGRKHHNDGPAAEDDSGDLYWFEHGSLSRVNCRVVAKHVKGDGLPAWKSGQITYCASGSPVENADGSREWQTEFWDTNTASTYREAVITEFLDGHLEWSSEGVFYEAVGVELCEGCSRFPCGSVTS